MRSARRSGAAKRVLLTGHTGFKGGWLALWLRARRRGHGFALAPATEPSLSTLAGVDDGIDQHASATCATRDAVARVDARRAARDRASSGGASRWCGGLPRAGRHLRDQRDGHRARARSAARTQPTCAPRSSSPPTSATKPRVALALPRGRAARRPRSVQRQQGLRRARRRELPRAPSSQAPRHRARDRARRQRDRRRRLVARTGSSPTSCAPGRPAAPLRDAPPARDPAVAARARAARRLSAPGRSAVARRRRSPMPTTSARAATKRPRSATSSALARAAYGSGEWRDETEAGAPHEAAGSRSRSHARATCSASSARWPLAEAIGPHDALVRRLADGASAASLCAEDIDAFERAGTGAPWRRHRPEPRREPTAVRGHADRGPAARPPPAARRCAGLSRPPVLRRRTARRRLDRAGRADQPHPYRAARHACADCTSSGRRTPKRSSSTACAARSWTWRSTCGAARRPSCAGTPSALGGDNGVALLIPRGLRARLPDAQRRCRACSTAIRRAYAADCRGRHPSARPATGDRLAAAVADAVAARRAHAVAHGRLRRDRAHEVPPLRAPSWSWFLDLGSAPPSNAYLAKRRCARRRLVPAAAARVRTLLAGADRGPCRPRRAVHADYAYFSSFSRRGWPTPRRYVAGDGAALRARRAELVVEVAANDGYLLQLRRRRRHSLLRHRADREHGRGGAQRSGIDDRRAFFGVELGRRARSRRAPGRLIAANNVLAHVPDINDFVAGFAMPAEAATASRPSSSRTCCGSCATTSSTRSTTSTTRICR